MTVPVLWYSWHSGSPNPDHHWDQALYRELLENRLWRPPGAVDFRHCGRPEEILPDEEGAVVVIAARHEVSHVAEINRFLSRFRGVLVLLIGDEEGSFPVEALEHPNRRVWVMTGRPGRPGADRLIPNGWPPGLREVAAATDGSKNLNWFFAGQVTHERRRLCVERLRKMAGGRLVETSGFARGLPQQEYFSELVRARVVPCPSGPVHPDTFRCWEALEVGAIPLVEDCTPREEGPLGFWEALFPNLPFPVVRDDWKSLPRLISGLSEGYPREQNHVFSWWQRQKRTLAWNLHEDLAALGIASPVPRTPDDHITVLISTSPAPCHPDESILVETVESVRRYLPRAEIVIMCDGVRPELEHRRTAYEEYLRRLLWRCNFTWHNVLPVIFSEHQHQANMTRTVLQELVRTPLLLFVEHDTPLCGEIPFDRLCQAVLSTQAHHIRLHYDVAIHPDHRPLMIGEPEDVCGVPLLRTWQWSQRPHLAETFYYVKLLAAWFPPTCRTMIEDRMHGVVEEAWKQRGYRGWDEYRLWIYHPPGSLLRSRHSNARGSDPKFEMKFS